jgi:hypothetical protein
VDAAKEWWQSVAPASDVYDLTCCVLLRRRDISGDAAQLAAHYSLSSPEVSCAGTAEKVELPEDFFATTWASLKDFVSAVHALRFTEHSFEQLYGVRSACARGS